MAADTPILRGKGGHKVVWKGDTPEQLAEGHAIAIECYAHMHNKTPEQVYAEVLPGEIERYEQAMTKPGLAPNYRKALERMVQVLRHQP